MLYLELIGCLTSYLLHLVVGVLFDPVQDLRVFQSEHLSKENAETAYLRVCVFVPVCLTVSCEWDWFVFVCRFLVCLSVRRIVAPKTDKLAIL